MKELSYFVKIETTQLYSALNVISYKILGPVNFSVT